MPSIDHGVQSFFWAVVFFLILWLGMRRCTGRIVQAAQLQPSYGHSPRENPRHEVAGFRGVRARKEFREPVALSSTEPADFPLSRTALELGFDLVALRAPCKRHHRDRVRGRQVAATAHLCKLREVFRGD